MFEISVSGADAVTEGNHGGYIARTQPNTKLQGRMYAKSCSPKGVEAGGVHGAPDALRGAVR